jgi:hypothetical protein
MIRATAQRGAGPQEYSPALPTLVAIVRLWPSTRMEVIKVGGGDVMTQLWKKALPRFPAFVPIGAKVPATAGLEPFEKIERVADPQQLVKWHERLHESVSRLELREAESFAQIAREAPMEPRPNAVGGSAEGGTTMTPDAYQAKFRTVIRQLPKLLPLFRTAAPAQELLQEVKLVLPLVPVGQPVTPPELASRSKDLLAAARQRVGQGAQALRSELSPYGQSWAGLDALLLNFPRLANLVVVNVPDVELALAREHKQLFTLLEGLHEPAFDILVLETVSNLDSLQELTTYFDAMPSIFGTLHVGFDGYEDADQLLEITAESPRLPTIGAGHLCVYAGKAKRRGIAVSVASAALGRQINLSNLFKPEDRVYGAMMPPFGAHDWTRVEGLDDLDTLDFSEQQLKDLAMVGGINALTRHPRKKLVNLYLGRTRSSLRDWSQMHGVRFIETLTGHILCFLEEEGIGLLNERASRSYLCDVAHEQFVKPYQGKAEFAMTVEPAASDVPTEVFVQSDYFIPDPIESIRYKPSRGVTKVNTKN